MKNGETRGELEQFYLEILKIKWFENMIPMEEIMEALWEGSRMRGRPRKNMWMA